MFIPPNGKGPLINGWLFSLASFLLSWYNDFETTAVKIVSCQNKWIATEKKPPIKGGFFSCTVFDRVV